MYMTMRKILNENRAIANRVPNRAPAIAPAGLELLAEVGSGEDAGLAVGHWPIIEQAIKHS